MSRWTCSNQRIWSGKEPVGALVCLMIFDRWQGIHCLAQVLQSLLIEGQTKRDRINLFVALIPGWDSPCRVSKICCRWFFGI